MGHRASRRVREGGVGAEERGEGVSLPLVGGRDGRGNRHLGVYRIDRI